ncbi:MAG: hypothetical protein Kow0042_18670 [Calditrichia bacterium]
MSYKISYWIHVFLLLMLFQSGNALSEESYFGDITIAIGGLAPKTYTIQRALLYRNVSISYDSTALIQNSKSVKVLYYPQLDKGTDNVLRLIFGEEADSSQKFFDLFLNLGDTIPDSVNWKDDRGVVYLAYNGLAQPARLFTDHINGTVHLIKSRKSEGISGALDLNFQMPFSARDSSAYLVDVEGTFDVPVGEYRRMSLSTAETREKLKKKYEENIYLALVLSAFIIVIFGFR